MHLNIKYRMAQLNAHLCFRDKAFVGDQSRHTADITGQPVHLSTIAIENTAAKIIIRVLRHFNQSQAQETYALAPITPSADMLRLYVSMLTDQVNHH